MPCRSTVRASKWPSEAFSHTIHSGYETHVKFLKPSLSIPGLPRTRRYDRYEILDVAVLKDNSKFVSCGEDKAAFLWDVSTGAVVRRLQGHEQRINACCFSNEGGVLFTASYDKVQYQVPIVPGYRSTNRRAHVRKITAVLPGHIFKLDMRCCRFPRLSVRITVQYTVCSRADPLHLQKHRVCGMTSPQHHIRKPRNVLSVDPLSFQAATLLYIFFGFSKRLIFFRAADSKGVGHALQESTAYSDH